MGGNNSKAVPKPVQYDQSRGGPWRERYRSPLHVPEVHRTCPVDEAWFETKLAPVSFGPDGALNPHKPEDLEETLRPFKLLKRDGDAWEKAIYNWLDKRLDKWHQNCEHHAPPRKSGSFVGFGGDLQWEVGSVRLIYDEGRMDEFHKIEHANEFEPFLAFHGTQLANFRLIIENNFKVDSPGGWYGNGGYFTTSLVYAQHYIGGMDKIKVDAGTGMKQGRFNSLASLENGMALPKVGNTVYIFGVMLKPGSCHVIPEFTGGGAYHGECKNKPKKEGVDSHMAFVSPENKGNPYNSMGFRPVATREKAFAEEFVIFDKKRVLPRYIIGLKRVK